LKTILKQMMLTLAVLLLAVVNGSAQVLSSVYSFDNNTNDDNPNAGLLLSGSTLYGTALGSAYNGGGKSSNLSGAVFKLNTNGTGFTNFYLFSLVDQSSLTNTDGANSAAQLVLSGNRLYGTTERGGFYKSGSFASGTVFAINTDGTGFTNLYNFSAEVVNGLGYYTNKDGVNPSAGLVLSGSKLFGTTSAGGIWGSGTVFAINTDGTGFTNLYSFNPTNGDGSGQKSSLILSSNTLYGTAQSGGSSGNGTVFAVNTDGTGFTNLHTFSALVRMATPPYLYTNGDGALPQGSLVLAGNKLYGTTMQGGNSTDNTSTAGGTVFALNTDGTGFTNLHNFGYSTGNSPHAGLILSGSTLYGTASAGGSLASQKSGTVFAINPDGTGFATLHTFTPRQANSSGFYTNADGSTPESSLILSGSTLYGTTQVGGANGFGTVIALNLALAAPIIQFTANPTNGVPPLAVQFNAPAVDSGGNAILYWGWNFGDGSNSIVQNPTHTYSNAAAFFPTLTCINNNGSTVIGSGPAIIAAYPSSILNGGFETGTFTNWTQSGITYSIVTTGSKYAHSGTYGAALETGGAQGFLVQTLATIPGANYLISFWLDSPSATTPNNFQMSWNGSVLLNKTNVGNIGWTNIQLTVAATATTTTLQFGYLNGYFYFGLDDISVTQMTNPNIANISLSGTNLVLNGVNGMSGTTNYLLMGTNLMQPMNQWTRIATNILGASGNFNITATNAVDPKAPGRFYILQFQ
jgi:uncharacterized repeat protein (TIGR03803 family)